MTVFISRRYCIFHRSSVVQLYVLYNFNLIKITIVMLLRIIIWLWRYIRTTLLLLLLLAPCMGVGHGT